MLIHCQCDGTRPRCTRCKDNELVCQYDVAAGVSRAERMKLLKRESISTRVEELERVMNGLRSGSDIEASTLLARLRLGERMDIIAKSLPSTSSSMLVSSPPSYAEGQPSIPTCVAQLNDHGSQLTGPGFHRYFSQWRKPGLDVRTG